MPQKHTLLRRLAVGLLALSSTLTCMPAYAENTRNTEFLNYTDGQRHWFYAGAYDTLGHFIFLYDQEKAQCVWRWMADNPKERKALLMKSFEAYPDHAPTSVIISLLQRDCGPLLPQDATEN